MERGGLWWQVLVGGGGVCVCFPLTMCPESCALRLLLVAKKCFSFPAKPAGMLILWSMHVPVCKSVWDEKAGE